MLASVRKHIALTKEESTSLRHNSVLVHTMENYFYKEVPASAYSFLRMSIGVLGIFYFLRLFLNFNLFLSTDGLIEHKLVREVFWFTWLPGQTLIDSNTFWYFVVVSGLSSCLLVSLGYVVRLSAFMAFASSVFLYRHNFLVMFVDDAIMHLMFFWLLLSPFNPKSAVSCGLVANCIKINVSLLYFVAGIAKWSSPMWIDGTAIAAVLKSGASLPWLAVLPTESLPILKLLTWGTLLIEPCFAAIPFTRGRLQLALVCLATVFHVSIILTLDIIFANLACLALLVFLIRINKQKAKSRKTAKGFREVLAFCVIGLIATSSLLSLAQADWRSKSSSERHGETGSGLYNISQGSLWLMGIGQQYRLFDWIDSRNYELILNLRMEDGKVLEFNNFFPKSTRLSLLLSYLTARPWAAISEEGADALKKSISNRIISKLCNSNYGLRKFELNYVITKVLPTERGWGESEIGQVAKVDCLAIK